MAKVTDFEQIDLSSLDGNDIFYVIDYRTEDDPNPKSKKISYSRLTQDLNDRVGLNSLLTADTFKDGDKTYLCMVFELKNGSQKTLCVDVGDLIDVYQGDGTTIQVDSDKTIKVIASYLSSTIELSGIDNNSISSYALKSELTSYGNGSAISVDGIGTSKTINVKVDANGNIAITDGGLSVGDYIIHDEVKDTLALSSRDQLNIPTKVSDLENDSGFISSHQQLKTINNIDISGSGNLGFLSSDTQFITINGTSVKGSGSLELLSSYDYSTISSGIGLGNYSLKSDLSTYDGSESISVGGDGTSKTIYVKLNPNGNIVSTSEGLSAKESVGKEYVFGLSGFQTTSDKTTGQVSVSLKIGQNLGFDNQGQLTASGGGSGGSEYYSGQGTSIDSDRKINILVAEDGKLSFANNKLSVGDFVTKATYIMWEETT